MTSLNNAARLDFVARLRRNFVARDFIFHDGRDLKRFSIGARAQAALAGVAAVSMMFSAYGVAQAAVTVVHASGALEAPASADAKVRVLQAKVASLQSDVARIQQAAAAHAARVEQRQAVLTAALTGKGSLAALDTPAPAVDAATDKAAAAVTAPLRRVETKQLAIADQVAQALAARYQRTAGRLRQLGIAPERLAKGKLAMGGPYEPVTSAAAAADIQADAQFRTLFATWKRLDNLEQGVIAIPTIQPVQTLSFTSNFGVRADPFKGTAAFHAGVDIPGPIGTPVYATADGLVDRAERSGGYGNMVELDHGKGIQTRYGHLSKILVSAGTHVHRGQLIALIGSTGRSTGPHLHYEVRIDGHAVNPVPFLQTADYLLGAQDRALKTVPAAVTTAGGAD